MCPGEYQNNNLRDVFIFLKDKPVFVPRFTRASVVRIWNWKAAMEPSCTLRMPNLSFKPIAPTRCFKESKLGGPERSSVGAHSRCGGCRSRVRALLDAGLRRVCRCVGACAWCECLSMARFETIRAASFALSPISVGVQKLK